MTKKIGQRRMNKMSDELIYRPCKLITFEDLESIFENIVERCPTKEELLLIETRIGNNFEQISDVLTDSIDEMHRTGEFKGGK